MRIGFHLLHFSGLGGDIVIIFQDGEENLFFRQADFLDDEEVEKYDVVEYSVIKTYDRKRQQMSSKAVLLKVLYEEINY